MQMVRSNVICEANRTLTSFAVNAANSRSAIPRIGSAPVAASVRSVRSAIELTALMLVAASACPALPRTARGWLIRVPGAARLNEFLTRIGIARSTELTDLKRFASGMLNRPAPE